MYLSINTIKQFFRFWNFDSKRQSSEIWVKKKNSGGVRCRDYYIYLAQIFIFHQAGFPPKLWGGGDLSFQKKATILGSPNGIGGAVNPGRHLRILRLGSALRALRLEPAGVSERTGGWVRWVWRFFEDMDVSENWRFGLMFLLFPFVGIFRFHVCFRWCTLQGTNISPPWEKENHLQTCHFWEIC